MGMASIGFLGQRFIASPSIATWASFVFRALPLVIFPPFIFRFFTTEEAAFWFLLITLQGLQLLLESSIGLTFVRSIGYAMGGATQVLKHRSVVALPQSKTENQDLLSSVWSVMRGMYPALGVITFILLVVMGGYSSPVLISKIPNPQEGWICLVLFVSGAALRAYGGLHVSYLYGVGKISLLRWWEMAFWAVAVVAVIATVMLGGNLVLVTLAYQIPLLVNLFWNMFLVRKDQDSRCNFVRQKTIDWNVFNDIWPGMWRATLGVFIYLGTTQGAGLYYAQIGSVQDVAIYLFAMSLMRPMMQFAQVPFMTKLPRLAALQASGERGAQRELVQRAMLFSNFLLALMVVSGALFLPLVAWISGGEVARVPLILWAIIGLASFLERVGAMHLQLYSQTNHILWHWANGGASVLFIIFAWALLPYIDMLAIPSALCLAIVLFYMPYAMWLSYRTYGFEFPAFEFKTSIVPCTLISLVVIYSIAEIT